MKFSLLIGVVTVISAVCAVPTFHPQGGFASNEQRQEEWESLTSAWGSGWRSSLAAHRSSFRHRHHHQTSTSITVSATSDSATPIGSPSLTTTEVASSAESSSSATVSSSTEEAESSTSAAPASSSVSATTSPSTPSVTPSNTSIHSSSPTKVATSSTNSPASSNPSSFATPEQLAYLTPHNNLRAQKGAVPLTWNNTLEAYAQDWANACVFKHSASPNGENLAAGTDGMSTAAGIALWTHEENSFSSTDPAPSHYTQVVWKDSMSIGCAVSVCNDLLGANTGDANFIVCEYYPPGNVIGQFAANVEA